MNLAQMGESIFKLFFTIAVIMLSSCLVFVVGWKIKFASYIAWGLRGVIALICFGVILAINW